MRFDSINKVYSVPKINIEPKLGHTSDEVQNKMFSRRVKVLKYIKKNGRVKISEISEALNIIHRTVANDVHALFDVHAIRKIRKGSKPMILECCIRYDGIYCVS